MVDRRVGAAVLRGIVIVAASSAAAPALGDGPIVARRPLARIEDFAPPESFIDVGGIKTHFLARGGSGPAVVLVHGFGASTHTWRMNIDALARSHRVLAVDMKGFGLTAKPRDGAYHPRAYAEHLLAFLDVSRLDRVVLVGHSLGGAVVTRLALCHPERVRALVLVAPAPIGTPRGSSGMFSSVLETSPRKDQSAGNISLGPAPALAVRALPLLLRASITPKTVESGLRSAYHDPAFVTPELVDAYYRPFTIEGSAEALAAMMTPPPSALGPPLPPLSSLNQPTLVVVGAHDGLVPAKSSDVFARGIPQATRIVFEASGHLPHEEQADAFNQRVLEFLGTLNAR